MGFWAAALPILGNIANTVISNWGNKSRSKSSGDGYGYTTTEGGSLAGGYSKSDAGTKDDEIKELWGAASQYNTDASAKQTENNRANMLMQMGYNTLGAIQQGIYNHIQNKAAMDYNSAEAMANRDFQERMSNTSYQRTVADMRKAGINPILGYQQGGASTPSGAMGTITGASMGLSSASALGNAMENAPNVPTLWESHSKSENWSKSWTKTLAENWSKEMSEAFSDPVKLTNETEKAIREASERMIDLMENVNDPNRSPKSFWEEMQNFQNWVQNTPLFGGK